jgi:hypothetical protein
MYSGLRQKADQTMGPKEVHRRPRPWNYFDAGTGGSSFKFSRHADDHSFVDPSPPTCSAAPEQRHQGHSQCRATMAISLTLQEVVTDMTAIRA